MPKIVVLGAGIGGISMAYELRTAVGRAANVTVVSDSEWFHFVPSNPWVALRWRKPEDIKVHLPEVLAKLGIGFDATGAKRVLPAENALELNDGRRLSYDYLVIATGPALAFRSSFDGHRLPMRDWTMSRRICCSMLVRISATPNRPIISTT